MIEIDIKNVQAIGEAHLEIEENSIVEFVGDNSNGKSVIAKVISALTSGDIRHNDVRRSLIKDTEDTGVVVFTHGDERLGVLMRDAVKDSYIMYIPNKYDENYKILRTLNDVEGCDALIKKFGFRTYNKGDICLQLSPTWGAIPFITTGGAVNHDIVQDITVDKVADEFLKTFSSITFPVFKSKIDTLKKDRDATQAILDNMEAYDWRAYEDIANRMREVYMIIKDYKPIQISKIPIPPPTTIYSLPDIKVNKIPIIKFYDYLPKVEIDMQLYRNHEKLMNGVCPTCGKPLVDKI